MKRFMVFVGLVCLTAQGLLAADLRQQVRDAASVIYVHGMTQEIADREVGPEGIPYLLELLDDPEFERRDNVVAFLIFLGHDSEAQPLGSFLSHPVGDQDRPEEHRARLLVPQALAGIANRGGMVAEALLRQLSEELQAGEHADIAPMIEHGMSMIEERNDVAPDPGDDDDSTPLSDDTYSVITRHDLTHANHVDTNNKITDPRVDDVLDEATKAISFENGSVDVGCCVQLTRTVPGALFGTPGDGLDTINTGFELNQVLGNPIARIKIVDLIAYCGGPGANIIGCANRPGTGVAVVRLSNVVAEALLWAHEYGHNTGLVHNSQPNYIMTSGLVTTNTKLTAYECTRLHAPLAQANADVVNFGDCHDDDNDGYQTSYDNCPFVFNFTQADNDDDGLGNECDNCEDTPNPDQEDCDADDIGDACDPVNLIPGSVDEINFYDPNRLIWTASAFSKNIYRGSYAGPPAPWIYNQVVVDTVPAVQAQWFDTTTPDPETINFYLMTNFNGCGESD